MAILFSLTANVTCSALAPAFQGDTACTIGFRVNPTALAGFQALCGVTMPAGGPGIDRFFFNGAVSQFQWTDTIGNRIANRGATAAVWQYLAFVYDPSVPNVRGYDPAGSTSDGPTRTGRPIRDTIFAGFSVFQGQDFVVYNAALNAAEIAQLAAYRKPIPRPANLYCWLPMDAGAGRNLDRGPNNLTFVEAGGVADAPSQAAVPWAPGGGGSFRERMTASMGRRRIR